MRDVFTLLLSSILILNSIELGLQSNRLQDHDPNPNFRDSKFSAPSSSSTGSPHSSARFALSAEPSFRSRSRSPLRKTFQNILGYRFEDIARIRLSPNSNPNRLFELREFIFPSDQRIGVKNRKQVLIPIPPEEKIVLSTFDGDVCAILHKSRNRQITSRALYTSELVSAHLKRAKFNMDSRAVDVMTTEEIADCPVSSTYSISNYYKVVVSSESPHPPARPSQAADPSFRDRFRITLKKEFPKVLGYKFGELASIRLSPRNNLNRIFILRIYVFPPDKPIGWKSKTNSINPMPAEEKLVLSMSNGDVFATFEKTLDRHTVLRAIYISNSNVAESKRAKINANSNEIRELTPEEILECPVAGTDVFKKKYCVTHV